MISISSATGRTLDISTISNDEKDQLIQTLQQEVEVLKDQVEEFNNLRNSVLKATGKNGVRKLKDKYLTTNDKVNANKISYFLHETIWPHVKMMPEKWHKWSDNCKSKFQHIMSIVGLPSGFIPEDYWMGVAQSLVNNKLCSMRANIEQGLFQQFKRMYMHIICLITLVIQF
jgi:hypothetical protein